MAFQLKQLLQVNSDGDRFWSTDKTGAYVASFNETGWGTPNPVLSQSAILFIGVRKDVEDTFLTVVGASVFYDGTALNSKENSVEFVFAKDGWHRVIMMVFDVSTNGTTLVKDDLAIPNNAYYYYNGSLYQWLNGAGALISPDDYIDFIDNDAVVQDYAEGLIFPQLSIILTKLYRQYMTSRDGNCDDKDYLLTRYDELRNDIESAYNLFWTGLTIQAADLINSLLDKYSDIE